MYYLAILLVIELHVPLSLFYMDDTSPLTHEKVYSVSGTPSQHTCGVSKTNENLTNGIKITTH